MHPFNFSLDAKNDILIQQIQEFRKKLYLKNIYTGLLLFFISTISAFIIFNLLEYFGNFNSIVRSLFFFSFITLTSITFIKFIAIPTYKYFIKEKELNDLKTAELMGNDFPSVKDKLVNYLQLKTQSDESLLAAEALKQKKSELIKIPFIASIKFDIVKKYSKYSLIPLILLLGIFLVSPAIFSEGSNRIINFQKTFVANAPFKFNIVNTSLKAFQNEDFKIEINLTGSAFPEQVYIEYHGRKLKMEQVSESNFVFVFKNLQSTLSFNFEASGYSSPNYNLEVIQKPQLNGFKINVDYPKYTDKKSENFENIGSLNVPEGSVLHWEFTTKQTDSILLRFNNYEIIKLTKKVLGADFEFSKSIKNSTPYTINLLNADVNKPTELSFNIDVTKDQVPYIQAEFVQDTTLYRDITIGGSIKDDYGFTKLNLIYQIFDENKKVKSQKAIAVPIDLKNNSQNFYYSWNIDTLHLQPGEYINYYMQIWDNDGVNGSKSAKSIVQELKMPNQQEIEKQLNLSSEQTENQLQNSMSKAMELQKEFDKLQNKIKGKKNLDWQDKKSIEDYLKKHDQLKQEIDKLSELNQKLNEKNEKFSEEDLRLAEKAQQLQNLIENIMDEDTKKMWEELQKMINEKNKDADIQDMLNKMDQKDESLEKELDRAMEFYKQLQFDRKLEENISKLEELSQKQQELSEKAGDKNNQDINELQKQQQELSKEFDQLKDQMKEMNEINNSLENKHDLQGIEQMQKDAEQKMQDSQNDLNQNNKKSASKKQNDASKKMKEMANAMQKMKQDAEAEQKAENIDDLRQILENLLKLSFDQEELMKNMKVVNKSDPKYLQYSQEQLKLKDDAKVIEDSLYALSKREASIEGFISKEVANMKNNMDESSKLIKKREPYFAAAKQQAAMTSMNNLALMLDDALKSMQEQQKNAQQKQGGGSCSNPNGKGQGQGKGKGKKSGKGNSPGQMQRELSEQMQDLLNGNGKSGNKMSEQLAKMAAQQERIRKAMQELEQLRKSNEAGKKSGGTKPDQEGSGGDKGKNGNSGSGGEADKLMQEMDKIEEEIVNKRISPELIKRQKELTTRLLDFEKSVREREMEERRESNTAKELERPVPPSLQKYFNQKNKITELIRAVPPSLNGYYKKKVNEFYQNLNH